MPRHKQFVDWSVYDAVIAKFAEEGKSAQAAADHIAGLTRHPVTRNAILGRANRLSIRFSSVPVKTKKELLSSPCKWEKADDTLRELVAEGLPAVGIAEKLTEQFGEKFSRDMVLNRCRRLGIKLSKGNWKNRYVSKAPVPVLALTADAREAAAKAGNVVPVWAGHLHISIMELGRNTCRWPTITDAQGELRYCGQDVRHEGRVYCPRCHKKAHAAPYVYQRKSA